MPSVSKARVRICGEEMVIRGEAPPEYIQELAGVVDRHMRAVHASHPKLILHRVAILAAVNLADELHQLKEENRELLELVEEAGRG